MSVEKFKTIPLTSLQPTIQIGWSQTLSLWYLENKFSYPLRVFLAENKLTFKFAKRLHSYIHSRIINIRTIRENYARSLKRLSSTDKSGYDLNSEYGYAGDVFINELTTAHKYKKQIDEGFNGPSESRRLYEHIVDVSTDLLERTHAPCYYNFGVSYAYTDSILARKFPTVSFFGIERTDAARVYNERFFGALQNLKVQSGDVFELFEKNRFDGGVFFHSRTLLLLPQEFIRQLYVAVRKAGFEYIVGAEQYGISRQVGRAYEFSYEYQDSVVYRDFMYIHNWPNILKDCGFELQRIESITTDHPHADFRILSFEARVVSG